MNRRGRCALSVFITAALTLSSCASGDTAGVPAEARSVDCETEFAELVDLLKSGLPTYDYDPATDLGALIERSDMVVGGTIASVVRMVEEAATGEASWTTITAADAESLIAGETIGSDFRFSTDSVWALRGEPDPLANPVDVVGLAFVAFLRGDLPGALSVDVQGLHVSCVGSRGLPTSIIQGLPNDALNISLDALVERLRNTTYPLLESPAEMNEGETRIARSVNTHCGVEWLLLTINDQRWKATDLDQADATGVDLMPRAWGTANDNIDLVITLVDSVTIRATVAGSGVTVTYQPGDDFPLCF